MQAGVVGLSFKSGDIYNAPITAGSFYIDVPKNSSVYGPEAGLDAILSGRKEAPEQFSPFYAALTPCADEP